jgi:ABC-type transport system involved in cytochrome bd biosynthesis fused ATPase/permease subunit
MLRLSQRLPALRYCQSGTRIGTFGLAGYTNTRSAACVRTAVRLRRGRTSFVIATGCPPSATPDTIVVMDNGRIVEEGSHHDLLRRHGFFDELYNSQFTERMAKTS